MGKFEIGDTVFACYNGELHEYEVVAPKGLAPADKCDMLIKGGPTGGIASAKSKSYHATPLEAAKAELKSAESGADTYQSWVDRYQKTINKCNALIAEHGGSSND